MLPVRHDDDDDIYIYIERERERLKDIERKREEQF